MTTLRALQALVVTPVPLSARSGATPQLLGSALSRHLDREDHGSV